MGRSEVQEMRMRCVGGALDGREYDVQGERIIVPKTQPLDLRVYSADELVAPVRYETYEYVVCPVHTPEGDIFFLRPVEWTPYAALRSALGVGA